MSECQAVIGEFSGGSCEVCGKRRQFGPRHASGKHAFVGAPIICGLPEERHYPHSPIGDISTQLHAYQPVEEEGVTVSHIIVGGQHEEASTTTESD